MCQHLGTKEFGAKVLTLLESTPGRVNIFTQSTNGWPSATHHTTWVTTVGVDAGAAYGFPVAHGYAGPTTGARAVRQGMRRTIRNLK